MTSNRARTRTIRAEMAETGDSYTRSARAVSHKQARRLRAVCFSCRRDIPAGGGVIHIRHDEVYAVERANRAARERRLARAAAEGKTDLKADILTLEELDEENQQALWHVHCDACNPHQDHCGGCYWFETERCQTWAQLVHLDLPPDGEGVGPHLDQLARLHPGHR